MSPFARILRHLIYPDWWYWRRINTATMGRVERAIADSEARHTGEIRVVIETSLSWPSLLSRQVARERALDVFSLHRVWDTAANNGVLIYLLLADRDVEIIADRGVAGVVDPAAWEAICLAMEEKFAKGEYEAGLLHGVREVGRHLHIHFPCDESSGQENINELPDHPVRL